MPLQTLFDAAIERASQGEEGGCGYQWYVYSYQAGYLMRRGAFILEKLGEHFAYMFYILPARRISLEHSHQVSSRIVLRPAWMQPADSGKV